MQRYLDTAHGRIELPSFLPVTTYGGRFPLDEVVRPYLDRLAPAIMVSYHYAQKMKRRPNIPLFVDSGGFASLFKGSEILKQDEVAIIKTKEGSILHPQTILDFQQKNADIGATLDFLITPKMDLDEAQKRQSLTIINAIWAVRQVHPEDFKLFASIQAWDQQSAISIMEQLAPFPFDGFTLGGMVPRVKTPERILEIVRSIRTVDKERPLHVFGVGKPSLINSLYELGVDTVDSSSFLKYAANKKWLNSNSGVYMKDYQAKDLEERCNCSSCSTLGKSYLFLDGELNAMALALHNLSAINSFTRC